MLDKSIAVTFVHALLDAALKKKKFEQIEKDLEFVCTAIKEYDNLKKLLLHPSIPREEKKDLIRKCFGASVSDLMINFMCLLVDKRKEKILEFIPEVYQTAVNEKKGVLKVVVQATIPIAGERLDSLKKSLNKLTGKDTEVEVVQNPDILGGMVISMENTMIDGSVAGRLKNLKTRLLELPTA